MATLSELLSQLNEDNYVRGRQFERICKWYLQNDPRYKLQLETVWLWSEWPEGWGPDTGIDLVAETHGGKLWAIQAKAYALEYHITKADIDTFLSESSRRVFSYRLLIATTDFVGRHAQRTLRGQEKPVGRVLLSDLSRAEIEWPASPECLIGAVHAKKRPRPHQEQAISDVLEGLTKHDRGQLVMASGTGKTLVSLWIAERLRSQRTLVLVPSLSLMAQTIREWTLNTSRDFEFLPVCSDDTVRGEDHIMSSTSELGLPATTNPEDLAKFLGRDSPTVVFVTYQSSPVVAEAVSRHWIAPFDLAISDEAHRCAGRTQGYFATILDADAIPARKRLFMTATPRYFTDRVREEAEEVECEIASMDDEAMFGPLLHKLSFAEAVAQNLLSDYQVVIIAVDNPTYLDYTEHGTIVTFDGEHTTDARILGSQLGLIKAMRSHGLRRVVSFHSRIKRAKVFSDRLPDVVRWVREDLRPEGKVWSEHVSGKMPAGQRTGILNRLADLAEDERGLVANARCLGEGVDVPALDGIAFVDPRGSQLDIVQAVGRVMRRSPEKEIGTIVLPVFIAPEKDPETALNTSAFKSVWRVLKALRAHDDVLGETLDNLRRQLGEHSGTSEVILPEKLVFDLPVTVDESFAKALRLKAVEQSTATWEFSYGLLTKYVLQHGHSRVPSTCRTENGYSLGSWVQTQRKAYRKGDLTRDRRILLEQLPLWTWGLNRAKWKAGCQYLKDFVELEGHSRVPWGYVTATGYKLGVWVNNQRTAYRAGRLSAKRRKGLESIEGWTWGTESTAKRATITEYLSRLREYVRREGHSLVPVDFVDDDGSGLGRWVARQRREYANGRLSLGRRLRLLQVPGWTWNDSGLRWEEGLELLRDYVIREGHAHVSRDYTTPDGSRLGRWLSIELGALLLGDMSDERLCPLKDILRGRSDRDWEKGLTWLRWWFQIAGHVQIPTEYVTPHGGFPVGMWVRRRQRDYVSEVLLAHQREMLDRFLGWTETCLALAERWRGRAWVGEHRAPGWVKGFKLLRRYADREGHTFVPKHYTTCDGYLLGRWVSIQRSPDSKRRLSPQKRRMLEKLPAWVWNASELPFLYEDESKAEGFACLRDYVAREGNALVPKSYVTGGRYRLGAWVQWHRSEYIGGGLPPRVIWLLEQFPGWTWHVRPPVLSQTHDINEGKK